MDGDRRRREEKDWCNHFENISVSQLWDLFIVFWRMAPPRMQIKYYCVSTVG